MEQSTCGSLARIIDRLHDTEASGKTAVSFEFFPAKTQEGVWNLLRCVQKMSFDLRPVFVTITWRAEFKDESLWLQMGLAFYTYVVII